MARVKGALATRKRRNKVLKLAKGYFGAKSKLFKTAKEAVQLIEDLKPLVKKAKQYKNFEIVNVKTRQGETIIVSL